MIPLEALTVETDFDASAAPGTLEAETSVYYCDEGNDGLCYFGSARIETKVTPDASAGAPTLHLSV